MGSVALPGSVSNASVAHPHIVHFYSTDAFLMDELKEFIGSGLSSGSSAVVIATKAHIELLARKLNQHGVNLVEAIAENRYQAIDAAELLARFFDRGKLSETRFYDAVGEVISKALLASRQTNRILAFGEMVALLWADGEAEAAIELEKLWNALARSFSFTLRCAYPMQGFRREEHADLFVKICAEHSHVISDGTDMAFSHEYDSRDASGSQASSGEFPPIRDWRKRERRFRLLIEAVQDYAIFMLDTNGRITSWNAGAERIKGYLPSEIIGQHFSRFYPPEDIESGKPERLMQKAKTEGHAEDEGWRVRKGGEKFWAHVTLTAVHDEAGTLIGFGKVTRDITERKRAEEILRRHEERFRVFIEAVQDYALFMLDADGYVSTWNKGAERTKGYKASEIIGRCFSCFYPEEDIKAGKPDHNLKIAAREGRIEDEGWRVRKDGSRFWANVVITAIKDENGKVIGFGKVTRDLTERMLAQQKIQESEASLRDLSLHLLRTQDEERRRIGREIHDSVGQYLSVLKMKLDAQTRQNEELGQCSALVDECVKEVRTISYLLYPPMLEEMGLAEAIPWYLEGFSKRSKIKTTFSVAKEFGRLPRDAELVLFRVLQESLTNVQRHSGSKSANIQLLRKGDSVTLEVSDAGKGVPTAVLEQSSRDWMGSLGVGLRGMSERVRQLGGTLQISSGHNGTTVRATLPSNSQIAPSPKA
jgi:PAS domain S-box-containing protein